jgi:hypothetical protein
MVYDNQFAMTHRNIKFLVKFVRTEPDWNDEQYLWIKDGEASFFIEGYDVSDLLDIMVYEELLREARMQLRDGVLMEKAS